MKPEIITTLAEYGATLDEDNFICKNGKRTGVKVVITARRLRMEAESGRLLFSSAANPARVGYFVEKFWYWEKAKGVTT
jgi:hypothetical protein